MWFDILKTLLLAQTEQEKKITYVGVALLFLFLFVMVLDTFSKGRVFPTKGPIKKLLIIACVIVGIVVILLTYVYK